MDCRGVKVDVIFVDPLLQITDIKMYIGKSKTVLRKLYIYYVIQQL